MSYKIDKTKGLYMVIGKRIIEREYLTELNKYPGQLAKLIENEIDKSNNLLEKKLINN